MIGWNGERWFTLADLPPVASCRSARVLALAAPGYRSRTAAVIGRCRPLGTAISWVPSRSPHSWALRAATARGLRAVSLAAAYEAGHITGLALLFSAHLRDLRMARGIRTPGVTSATEPHPPPACVALPHLVTVATRSRAQDTVVWELMPRRDLAAWFGPGEFPPLAPIVGVLPQLLAARRLARAGLLDRTGPAGTRTATLLRRRYLSILLVLQHADLFLTLAEEIRARRCLNLPAKELIP